MTPPPRRSDRGGAAELEGFYAGVVHELTLARREGHAFEGADRALEHARRLLSRGIWREAEAVLLDLDSALRARAPPDRVYEPPRGLLNYTPSEGASEAPPPDTERLRNRMELIGRLIGLGGLTEAEVTRARRALAQALTDLAAGKFAEASAQVDKAHALVEPSASVIPPAPPSGGPWSSPDSGPSRSSRRTRKRAAGASPSSPSSSPSEPSSPGPKRRPARSRPKPEAT